MQEPSGHSLVGRFSLIRPEFFAPKYWPTWSGIGILRILELLPYATQRFVGSCLGSLIRHLPLAYIRNPRPNTEPCFPPFSRAGRPIAHDASRSMLAALRHNQAVWYAPDQSYRNKGAVMANFFAIPAATSTATSRLARISGAAVLTYFPERLPGDAGYRVHIGPELEDYPCGSAMHDVNRFNALLQAQILKVPEQYLWMHRRFKGLRADYPDYYGRSSRDPRRP